MRDMKEGAVAVHHHRRLISATAVASVVKRALYHGGVS
jgi:hypothetical protein